MNDNHAKEQAAAQYASIETMLRAADPDTWERLEELQDMEQDEMTDDDKSELLDLLDATREYEDADAAREAIEQDALSVEYRSDWCAPGEEMTPVEFRIVLCTGGPAVRIRGEMDEHGEPTRAWLEYQNWGTPWTQYFDADQDVLLAYARHYVFAG